MHSSEGGEDVSPSRPLSRIWSPPILQVFVLSMTGTGLLPYIRPVDGDVMPLASMKCARIVLIDRAVFADPGDYQVFDTPV